MLFFPKLRTVKLITLGTKVLFGVTVVTSLLIGALVSINLKSAHTIEKTVDEVLETREQLSSNLRETIVELQNEFLELPDFFNSNPQQRIIDSINSNYNVVNVQTFTGRDEYKTFFSRRERRDVSKGNFVVKNDNGMVFLSYGKLDENQAFTDAVVRMEISTNDPLTTVEGIQQLIATIEGEESGEQALARKVTELGDMVAETGLNAEQTRTEILQHVENITAKERMLGEIRQQQRDLTVTMGIGAIVANMLILFFLIRLVIERPLAKLTHTIGEINNGNIPDIPLQNRDDQIGVLSGAMEKFRQVLLELREEGQRKAQEKEIIEDTVVTVQKMIDTIEPQARDLAELSESLQNIAERTGQQAGSVASNAEETAGHTRRVADASIQLEDVTNDIGCRIINQNQLVGSIVDKNRVSQRNMKDLSTAVGEIDSIIALVGDITEQTQLLALNATIEAARAGDAGKGFSIVASEMKELSGKTKQAASDVLSKVDAINGAGETLIDTFNDIETALEQLDAVTAEISAGIAAQQTDAATIRELAGKTSSNTNDVSSSIRQVNEAAGETSILSVRVHEFADSIASQLEELSAITTKLHDLREGAKPLKTLQADLSHQLHPAKGDQGGKKMYSIPSLQQQAA